MYQSRLMNGVNSFKDLMIRISYDIVHNFYAIIISTWVKYLSTVFLERLLVFSSSQSLRVFCLQSSVWMNRHTGRSFAAC